MEERERHEEEVEEEEEEARGEGGREAGGWGGFNSPTTVFSVPFIRHTGQLSPPLRTNFLHVAVGEPGSPRRAAAAVRPCGRLSSPLRGWCVIISSGEAEADILPRSGGALTPRGHPRTRDKAGRLRAAGLRHVKRAPPLDPLNSRPKQNSLELTL